MPKAAALNPENKVTYTDKNKVPNLEEKQNEVPKVWQPTDEERSIVERLLRRHQDLVVAQQHYHQEWDDAITILEAEIPEDPTNTKERFRIPWSHTIIDTAVAEELDAFPDIAVDTQEATDKQKLPLIDAAKKYALSRTNWDKVKQQALRLRRVYGHVPVRIYFCRETRIIKQRKPVKGDDGITIKTEEVIDYPWDDIKIEIIDNPKRFLIDDAAKDIDEAEDCMLETEMSWAQFKQMVQHDKRYQNIEYVQPGCAYRLDDKHMLTSPLSLIPDETKRVVVLEYWNKYRDEYVVMANNVLIRPTCLLDDHKELPFAVLHMHRRPHTFYSKGIPKLIESLEAAYNAIMQAEVRATKLAFPILATSDDSVVDPRSIASYPGVVLDGAKDNIELMQLGSVPGESYKLKDKIEELLIWVTGINYQQLFGEQSERVGIEALKKEGMLARVNANLRENEANFIVRLGNLLIQDIMQYFPAPKIRRLMAEEDISDLEEDEIVRDKDKNPIAKLEKRKIPMDGMKIIEEEDKSKKSFSLRLDPSGNSYILARPEYIRTKSRLDVRAVRPSAMGSSKEAKKLTLSELLNTAITVNGSSLQVNPETGVASGKLVWDLEALSKELAEVNDLPVKKVIVSEQRDEGRSATSAMEELKKKFQQTFKSPEPQAMPQEEGMPQGPAQPPMSGTDQLSMLNQLQ